MPPRTDESSRVFAVLNPMAGTSVAADVRQALGRFFNGRCEIYETTGSESEDVTTIVCEALERGFAMAVAAGGDGTVSQVAAALVGTDTPLGIIAVGTANVFAQELGLPLDLEGACSLLAGRHATTKVDVMKTHDRCFVLQIGIGIDSLMIRDTDRESKRRFGRAAYLWTAFTRLVGYQPVRFTIAADEKHMRRRALQVLLANGGVLGLAPFRWGPNIRPDDGRIDVCIVYARTALDYIALVWHTLLGQQHRDRGIRYLSAERSVNVSTDPPLPVQADGEIIGDTPLQVHIVPGALHVVVPEAQQDHDIT